MLGQVISGKFRVGHVRSVYCWLGQIVPGLARLVKVKPRLVRLCQIRSGYTKLG